MKPRRKIHYGQKTGIWDTTGKWIAWKEIKCRPGWNFPTTKRRITSFSDYVTCEICKRLLQKEIKKS